jgi:radical SAM superfamily enzyme YgiQ (UPF0313 family)
MKIAFIAMSGVRVVDTELLRIGLTLPGFVERGNVIASLPSLGLLTLAGMTPPWHEVSYHEVADIRNEPHVPVCADVIAISTFSAQVREAYELADRYRALGMRVVIGGPHVSVLPDEAGAHVDAVIIGEGELVWPQVLADAEAHNLQPRYGQRGVPFDLAHAPLPRVELLDVSRYNRITVQTARGCPHRCEFCASTPMMTPGYRQKAAEKVLAELDRIRALWPHPFIEFADDNTFVNRTYWKNLLPEISKRKLRWFTETDLSVADDDELLARMRDAGCAQVLIGLESPTPEALNGIDSHGWKSKRFDNYLTAIQKIQSFGISVNGCFILGLDAHDASVFNAVDDFVRESDLTEVQVTVQTAFPGTKLYERLLQTNRLIEPTNWNLCTLFDVNYHPVKMTATELRDGFRGLVGTLYSQERTDQRRRRFKELRRIRRVA